MVFRLDKNSIMDPTRPSGGSPRSDLLEEHSNAGGYPRILPPQKKKRDLLELHHIPSLCSAPRTDSSLLRTPHNGARFTTFLAQADAIKILMRGFLDFMSMLDFRARFLNLRIAPEALQQCPFLFVSRHLL